MLWFNAIEKRGNAWGVEVVHAYFSKHLPKFLVAAFPLGILEVFHRDRRQLGLLVATLAFVATMSGLAHKETRFIWYILPGWNLLASVCLARWYFDYDR